MGLVYQNDNDAFYLVVDDVVYFCSDVGVLLDVQSDVVVHDDQPYVDVLILDRCYSQL